MDAVGTKSRAGPQARHHLIVVGVSGSSASAAALRWAAEEARKRRARLRVVRAWTPPIRLAPYAAAGMTPDEARAAADRELADAMLAAFGPAPPGHVTAELAEGAAERALVDRSAGADLLVLGTHSPADAVARSVGPVIRACLTRAPCPVVVVTAACRPAAETRAPIPAQHSPGRRRARRAARVSAL